MSVRIAPASTHISDLISFATGGMLTSRQLEMIEWCQNMSGEMWTGWVDNDLVAVWGLIPPSLLSNQAYLWMYSTERVQEHTFLFVRNSQRMIERMLERYETINGHCQLGATLSMRWVRWLGGVFSEPDGAYIPFTIRRKHD